MPKIADNLDYVRAHTDGRATLLAVSKYHPAEAVLQAYEAGQRDFGESRAQELVAKHEALPQDIRWHFIGHLQPNKVKYIAPFVTLIHAVDSWKLLVEINRQALRCARRIPCLLEVKVAQEETKYGFPPEQLSALLRENPWQDLQGVEIAGVMCMASLTDDPGQIAAEFDRAEECWQQLRAEFFAACPAFALRSWGMSHDYEIALRHGSNLVRVGSAIFSQE